MTEIIIVTGASRGLGRAMALALAGAGADVAVAARAVAELEQTHAGLLRQRQQRTGELAELEGELARARSESPTETLTLEEEAALARALEADLNALLAAPNPRTALAQTVAREGERRRAALAGAVQRERERIDVLERRLNKLRAELATMERQLAELARRASLDAGLPSIYDSVQGLAPAESERDAKAQMLLSIFEQNLLLQCRA